ncbi:hypothetical protein D083_1544 [Dickeya solani RNS 08.23.3.1.A]|nr:hypothetical protein D083_1544 [Dickeya solani RNS 08.23.3.1.A]
MAGCTYRIHKRASVAKGLESSVLLMEACPAYAKRSTDGGAKAG